MTAFGGGSRAQGAESTGAAHAAAARPRPLEQIFPLRGDANRGREMQATWRSFCRDRSAAVKAVLAAGRSPPEIAYQLGELLHNHFRTRGVTLTSYELRRLIAELLALHGPPADSAPLQLVPHVPTADAASLGVPSDRPPPGDGTPGPAPNMAPSASELVPSAGSRVLLPEQASFPQLLTRTLELAQAWMVSRGRQAARAAVVEAIGRIAGELASDLPGAIQEQLLIAALSEIVGLGLIDRLWSDRTVRAILINGPSSVLVDRGGTLQPVAEGFRDQAHLLELMHRLAGRPAGGISDFRLRDGSDGVAIFPPVAPAGPVLILRRARRWDATLDQMVADGALDQIVADLLRLSVRSRLKILIIGPAGSGKTALLTAVARDLDVACRVVTVASHREFRWPAASKVELVASRQAPFSTLIAAAVRLAPDLVILDGVRLEDVEALSGLLQEVPGALASLRPDAVSAVLVHAADVVVRIDLPHGGTGEVMAVEDSAGGVVFQREGGKLVRGTGTPVFSGLVRARGHGDALEQLLH